MGVASSPKITILSRFRGFSVKKELFLLSDRFTSSLNSVFNRNESSLATGIVLGKSDAAFSKDFTLAMKNSGTTHLVALSGYNISVLVGALYLALSWFFKRRAKFFIAFAVIFLFVAMTGSRGVGDEGGDYGVAGYFGQPGFPGLQL